MGELQIFFPFNDDNFESCHFRKENSTVDFIRHSADSELNLFGKMIVNLCLAFELFILNGICNGDLEGRYTFITDMGSSVNDYFIASEDLFYQIQNNCKPKVSEAIDSDHQPLELFFHCQNKYYWRKY